MYEKLVMQGGKPCWRSCPLDATRRESRDLIWHSGGENLVMARVFSIRKTLGMAELPMRPGEKSVDWEAFI